MGDLDHRPPGAHAATSPGAIAPAPAPGKRTRTQSLPPRAAAEPLLADGLYCSSQPENTPGCYLDARGEDHLLQMIAVDALAASAALYTALGNVRIDLLTKQAHSWGPWHEVAFLLVTGAISGPISAALATAVTRTALPLAEAGATGAAWAAASYDAARAARALGVAFRGVRAELAHGGQKPPGTQAEFITYLQGLVHPTAQRVLQSVAAEQLNHDEMLQIHEKLNDPDLVGIPQISGRIRTLLSQFGDNRVAQVGQKRDFHGGLELACPVIVRYHRQTYMVLCESFAVNRPVVELNGANMDESLPRLTPESLVYVRIVERSFHELMRQQWQERRPGEPLLEIDLGRRDGRPRWANNFRVDLMHQPTGLAMGPADERDDDDDDAAVRW